MGRVFRRVAYALGCAALWFPSGGAPESARGEESLLSPSASQADFLSFDDEDGLLKPAGLFNPEVEHHDQRLSLWSGGHIKHHEPEHFPRIGAFDNDDPGSFGYSMRPNLFNIPIPDEWDPANLINTDRPDFTDAPFTAGKGVVIWESGYTFRRTITDTDRVSRRQLPQVLMRVGLTEELEFRVKWNGYVMTTQEDRLTGMSASVFGGDDLNLGVKYEMCQQDDWLPMLTVLGGLVVPTGTNGVSANQTQPYFNLVYGWGLKRWLYFKGSTGVDFGKSSDTTRVLSASLQEGPSIEAIRDNVSEYHQSFTLLTQTSKRTNVFVEWFALFNRNGMDTLPSHFLDTGIYIWATPHVQFDVRIGERLSSRVDTLFTGAGFSVRY